MVRRPAISFRHSMSAESYRDIVIDRPGSVTATAHAIRLDPNARAQLIWRYDGPPGCLTRISLDR